jgi:hypothetical protein
LSFSLAVDESGDAPGLPAAPLEEESLAEPLAEPLTVPPAEGLAALEGLVLLAGSLEELALLDGLVEPELGGLAEELALLDGLVDGLVEELELLDGLVVVPDVVPGLVVESALLAGLFESLRVVVLSRPESHAPSAKAIAEAITVLVKTFMMFSFLKLSPQERVLCASGPQTPCQCLNCARPRRRADFRRRAPTLC